MLNLLNAVFLIYASSINKKKITIIKILIAKSGDGDDKRDVLKIIETKKMGNKIFGLGILFLLEKIKEMDKIKISNPAIE
jgi:hypothetical protein